MHVLPPQSLWINGTLPGAAGKDRCRSCLTPSLSFLREDAKFIWDGNRVFGLEGYLETVGLFLNAVLAINELPLLNGRKCMWEGKGQKPAWTSLGHTSVSEELSINPWETHGMSFQWGPCVELEIRWERAFLVWSDRRRTWFMEAIKPEGSRRNCSILPLAHKPSRISISSETQTGYFTCEYHGWLLPMCTLQRAHMTFLEATLVGTAISSGRWTHRCASWKHILQYGP